MEPWSRSWRSKGGRSEGSIPFVGEGDPPGAAPTIEIDAVVTEGDRPPDGPPHRQSERLTSHPGLFDQCVNVHPLQDGFMSTRSTNASKSSPREQGVEIRLSQDGVEVDLSSAALRSTRSTTAWISIRRTDTINVDCIDNPGCYIIGHRLQKFSSFVNQRSESLPPGWSRRSPASRWSHPTILASPSAALHSHH